MWSSEETQKSSPSKDSVAAVPSPPGNHSQASAMGTVMEERSPRAERPNSNWPQPSLQPSTNEGRRSVSKRNSLEDSSRARSRNWEVQTGVMATTRAKELV